MTPEIFLGGKVVLHAGDSRAVLQTLAASSIDSIVTDPPYALVSITKRFGGANAAPAKGNEAFVRASRGFMGQTWDTGETAFAAEFWAECLRVLKPGGHVVAFSGTRTYHRMACAIEDAGFEVRDMLSWLYGSGFPKSHNVAIGIDKAAGTVGNRGSRFNVAGQNAKLNQNKELRSDHPDYVPYVSANEWQGWGTALKPACEPILLGRKPLIGTVAANILAHGVGGINIDGCRIESEQWSASGVLTGGASVHDYGDGLNNAGRGGSHSLGRWPANVLHDGSAEVLAGFPDAKAAYGNDASAKAKTAEQKGCNGAHNTYGAGLDGKPCGSLYVDSGSAARFFYTSKADSDDRLGSAHPTVKPLDLMQWLCRLVTPPGGTILDPFAGTGTTAEAAFREGFNAVLIERDDEYLNDIRRRMRLVMGGPEERARESIKARQGDALPDHGPLFAGVGE